MLSILNKPLRVWHALAMLGMVLALGVTGTAIAVQGKMNAVSTRATYTAGIPLHWKSREDHFWSD